MKKGIDFGLRSGGAHVTAFELEDEKSLEGLVAGEVYREWRDWLNQFIILVPEGCYPMKEVECAATVRLQHTPILNHIHTQCSHQEPPSALLYLSLDKRTQP